MGFVIKAFFVGVALVVGLGVGDIIVDEAKVQYKDYKKNQHEDNVPKENNI